MQAGAPFSTPSCQSFCTKAGTGLAGLGDVGVAAQSINIGQPFLTQQTSKFGQYRP